MKRAPLHRRPKLASGAPSRGFTLIEILVVLLLFSVGLLGLVGLQAKAMQVSVSGEDSNKAALMANELASAMWGSNSVTLPNAAILAWKTRLADPTANGLPNGDATVAVVDNVATITVTWRAPQEPATATHKYVTQVMIPVATAASVP
jgi:type IV pilus assembly protein PilV